MGPRDRSMTKFIEGDGKKIPDRWQFISDENDIETIFKKLDLILEHNARVSALYLKTQEDKWLTAALEQDIDILDKKLDWIAYRLIRLTISFGEGMNGNEVDEYTKLFKSVPQEIPKE